MTADEIAQKAEKSIDFFEKQRRINESQQKEKFEKEMAKGGKLRMKMLQKNQQILALARSGAALDLPELGPANKSGRYEPGVGRKSRSLEAPHWIIWINLRGIDGEVVVVDGDHGGGSFKTTLHYIYNLIWSQK